jgi:hypothetical protein
MSIVWGLLRLGAAAMMIDVRIFDGCPIGFFDFCQDDPVTGFCQQGWSDLSAVTTNPLFARTTWICDDLVMIDCETIRIVVDSEIGQCFGATYCETDFETDFENEHSDFENVNYSEVYTYILNLPHRGLTRTQFGQQCVPFLAPQFPIPSKISKTQRTVCQFWYM